jgi:hypothetical protein
MFKCSIGWHHVPLTIEPNNAHCSLDHGSMSDIRLQTASRCVSGYELRPQAERKHVIRVRCHNWHMTISCYSRGRQLSVSMCGARANRGCDTAIWSSAPVEFVRPAHRHQYSEMWTKFALDGQCTPLRNWSVPQSIIAASLGKLRQLSHDVSCLIS